MKRSKKITNKALAKWLNVIIILSVLGLATSIYLAWTHFVPPAGGSFCDISSAVSCSLVNSSVYSILFGVPVSIFGALWFVILGFAAYKAQKQKELVHGMLWWNWLGLGFVVYLIIAEIILEAICPMCTVVHIITIATFIMLFKLKRRVIVTRAVVKKALMPWIVAIVILNLIPIALFNFSSSDQVNYDSLTTCVTKSGVNMYGSFRCGICAKQKDLLGDSFEHINEIECHPQGENPQTDLCVSKKIEGTPTWILEPEGKEVKRTAGFLSIEELAEFSGCQSEVPDAS